MNKKIINIVMIIIICMSINLFHYKIYAIKIEPTDPVKSERIGARGGAGTVVNAMEEIDGFVTSPITNPDYYQPDSKDTVNGANRLKNMGNTIIGALQIIGSIVSVVVLVVLGIKYMIGSAEERAEYKKSMMPYIIGAIMVFAITNLLGIVVEVAKNLW